MSTEKRQPAETFCLAELLCDEMQARGWRTEDVAVMMGGAVEDVGKNLLAIDLLMCVQDDKLLVGERLFGELARVFDVDPEFFRNLDKAWRDAPPERRSPFTPPDSIFGPVSRRATMQIVS